LNEQIKGGEKKKLVSNCHCLAKVERKEGKINPWGGRKKNRDARNKEILKKSSLENLGEKAGYRERE